MLRIGMFIADRYEILEHIGSGGMSDVYKAKCHKLNRFVAIKVLKAEFAEQTDFVVKFRQEAQSAAILSHPNIVSIYDVGNERDIHYIVMELIDGITLKDYISSKGRLDVRESIGIAIQVAQGLAAAHEQKIVHRDIKPQNIIISRDAKVKVMDFGIARVTSGNTINSSSTMGSVHYISPEQARGGYCDERSDIYSLGITMYEMVTGTVPFDGENTVAIALAHIQSELKPPREYDPSIPVAIENIILKCTMKKPERRYSCAQDLIADLRKALVSPDENFVVMVPTTNMNQTKMMTQEEITAIRSQTSTMQTVDSDSKIIDAEEIIENSSEDHAVAAVAGGRGTGNLGPDEDPDDMDPEDNDEEEIEDPAEEKDNSAFDVIVLIIGIIIAIVIIVCAILLLTKFMDIYHYNPKGPDQTITDTHSSEQPTLTPTEEPSRDTEVKVPEVIGMNTEDAEKFLKGYNLGITIKEEYNEDVEKGIIFNQAPEKDKSVSKYSTVTVTVSKGSESVLVPEGLVGMTQTEAQSAIYKAGLFSKIEKENHPTVPAGQVISVDPGEGEKISAGGIVTIHVSLGVEILTSDVPNLVGQTLEEAAKILEDKNLNYEIASYEFSKDVKKDSIISQEQAPGSVLQQGSSVKIVVSKGEETVKMENYIGKTQENAKAALEEKGLKVEIEEDTSEEIEKGRVMKQSVDPDEEVPLDETIILTISTGSSKSKVPFLEGLTLEQAKQQLEEEELEVNVVYENHDSIAKDLVIRQSVAADKPVKKGTTITIYVSEGPKETPTPTPEPSPTPTPIPSPTPIPTDVPTPIPSLTPIPTEEPSPTPIEESSEEITRAELEDPENKSENP